MKFFSTFLFTVILPLVVMAYRLEPRRKLSARDIRLRVSSTADSYFSMQWYREFNVCSVVTTIGSNVVRRILGKEPDALMSMWMMKKARPVAMEAATSTLRSAKDTTGNL